MMTRRRLLSCGLLAGVMSMAYGAESTGQQGKGIDRKDVASASARGGLAGGDAESPPRSLWELANENKDILRISTWISAHHVETEEGLNRAIDWCKQTGVTRVFLHERLW